MTLKTDGFFVLPGAFDDDVFAQVLTDWTVRFGTATASKSFILLDCHDQSLRVSGQMLIETDGTLQLLQGNGESWVQNSTAKGRFVQELLCGSVREALQGFPELRALTGIGAGRVENRSLTILDDQQKTQVRGDLMALSCKTGRATIIRVQRLRGYDRAFVAVCSALTEMGGNADGVEAVFQALFPGMVPYQAKPEVRLGQTEPSVQVATDIIRTYLTVARRNEDGVIADVDTEFLHDYRVSLRRVRSVLDLFKGVFSERQSAELKQVFSDLMAPTGRVRDLDVYLLEKDIYFNLIPSKLHVGLDVMFEQFEKQRAQELSRLSRRFRSAAYDRSMNTLIELFSVTDRLEPGPNATRGANEYACALIWKRYRKVCKLARSINEETPDKAVHDLRIDCKKLRYLMEFFAPLFARKRFKLILKPLKKLQDSLGLFNDYSIQQEALLDFVSQQSNAQGQVQAQLGMAVGGLIAVLDQRQRAERDRVIASFQQFDGPDTRHLFRSLFHHKKE
ncbi:CHAD domain-containing protein [Rhodobacteraceae bacterium B1Z28]|uniref:CHAD domain-containing protein n=1 Tax=Ruegeria haliotis TaxID=2747601 RepID=A0ABX2PML8_9RHOB|nr:CHAD domain-containing protein [Ruegeria haliotis]NVO54974.1 CHAD domain-containing protein [Ruegeria haliotis]